MKKVFTHTICVYEYAKNMGSNGLFYFDLKKKMSTQIDPIYLRILVYVIRNQFLRSHVLSYH